jgi:hypothetical protein
MKVVERVAGAIAVVLLASAHLHVAAFVSKDSATAGGPEEARTIWEQAIDARGGRERLRAIRNFVTSSEEKFAHSPRPDVITHQYIERLYVMPTRFWEYDDYRPGKMGEGALALDTDQHRVLNRPDHGSAQGLYQDLVYRLRNGQVVYLMETAYVQPEPVGVHRDRVGRVDVVDTRVDGDRVEFSLDRRSHLPIKIVIKEQRRRFADTYRLRAYDPIDGIQMPSNVHFGDDDTKATTTYRFNVDYDEAIFRRESVRFEKNGWMKR